MCVGVVSKRKIQNSADNVQKEKYKIEASLSTFWRKKQVFVWVFTITGVNTSFCQKLFPKKFLTKTLFSGETGTTHNMKDIVKYQAHLMKDIVFHLASIGCSRKKNNQSVHEKTNQNESRFTWG